MATERIHPALQDYLGRLDDSIRDSQPSEFWRRQLEERAAYAVTSDEDAAVLARRVVKGYGFEDLPEGLAGPQEDPSYRAMIDGLKRFRSIAKQLDPGRMEIDKGTWEHVRSIGFLQRQGLLDDYLAFIEPLRVRSTMSTARHWYYARQVDNWATGTHGDGPLDVLEIGAGAGNLAVFLARMGRVRSYTIVDLPQMLVHSSFTAQEHIPEIDLRFEEAPRRGAWTFIPDGAADRLLDREAFDLCLNFNSFMEMDRDARDRYLDVIYRTARPGALFVNVNRRQPALPLPDGSAWDNNPLLYPYRMDDRILAWEEDRFQTITRTKPETAITLTVTRASVVKPTS